MEHILAATIGYLVPLVLGSGLGFMYHKLTTNQRQDAMLLALGRYRLINECEAILAQGYVTPTQYEMLNNLYNAYAGLGGNGVGQALYNRTIKLKIKEGEEQ
nr:MAG TPA: holin protein [Caudoviricetes sp.]